MNNSVIYDLRKLKQNDNREWKYDKNLFQEILNIKCIQEIYDIPVNEDNLKTLYQKYIRCINEKIFCPIFYSDSLPEDSKIEEGFRFLSKLSKDSLTFKNDITKKESSDMWDLIIERVLGPEKGLEFYRVNKSRGFDDEDFLIKFSQEGSKYKLNYISTYMSIPKKTRGQCKIIGTSLRPKKVGFLVTDIASVFSNLYMMEQCIKYIDGSYGKLDFILKDRTGKAIDESTLKEYCLNILNKDKKTILLNRKGELEDGYKFVTTLILTEMLGLRLKIDIEADPFMKRKRKYAKTYETKKNIPNKVLEAMKNNSFLKVFNFVELDDSCDLKLFEEVQQQFINYQEVLNIPFLVNSCLRFKRLGKYGRSEKYYSDKKTLCLEIGDISSFTYGLLKILGDYANIGSDTEFEVIATMVREQTEDTLNKIRNLEYEERRKFWAEWIKNRNSRIDINSNQEIFARMGELYIRTYLYDSSSFLSPRVDDMVESLLYPDNQEILNIIKPYYDKIFKKDKLDKAI